MLGIPFLLWELICDGRIGSVQRRELGAVGTQGWLGEVGATTALQLCSCLSHLFPVLFPERGFMEPFWWKIPFCHRVQL